MKSKPWKKFAVVGCSHGHHIDPIARQSVLDFKKSYEPDLFIHAGDFIDMEAFMGGGSGEGDPVAPDFQAGIDFLMDGMFDVVLCGNHEDRLWRLEHSSNEVVAECARMLKDKIVKTCDIIDAELIPYTGVFQKYRFSNALVTHGTIYNENASRDMAEMYNEANVIIYAHTHKVGFAKGRRSDCPSAYCVGTLTQRGAMAYAKNRRATMAWSQGIVYGEYNDEICLPQIYEHPQALQGKPWKIR